MPGRGKYNKNNNHRGRGGGHNRGHGRGRGRGRGGVYPTTGTVSQATAPAGHRRTQYPHSGADIDAVVQQWSEPSPDTAAVRGNRNGANGSLNRGTWLWRGGTPKPRSGSGTPSRGRGSRGRAQEYTYNGRDASHRPHFGVGAGAKARATPTLGKDAPLSALLYSERPLLRPVKFVRATLTPFLFQDSEDVLNPAENIPDTTETSHVPTADRVARLFHANAAGSESGSEDRDEDVLEEIDFANLAQVRAEIDAIAQGVTKEGQDVRDAQEPEDIGEVDFADLAAIRAQVDAVKPQAARRGNALEEAFTGFYSHVKDTTQVSRAMDNTPDDLLAPKPSIDILKKSNQEPLQQARDTILAEDVVLSTSNGLSDEGSSLCIHSARCLSDQDCSLSLSPDTHADPHSLFVIDTTPSHPFTHRSASDIILGDRTGNSNTLGDDNEDEERIVYVAPHPRSGRASPIPTIPRVKLPSTSILTGRPVIVDEVGITGLVPIREDEEGEGAESGTGEDHPLSLAALSPDPTPPPPSPPARIKPVLRAHKKEAGLRRKRQRQHKRTRMRFGAFGAMIAEARLREEDAKERMHLRWERRCRGDSDIDWGTEDENDDEDQGGDEHEDTGGVPEDDAVDALSNGLGGMEIDPDLDPDLDVMNRFLESMSAEGSRFVTMDDIEDEARMQREDEEGLGGPEGSSDSERSDDEEADDEEEEIFDMEEKILIAECEELSPDSDDDELSPRSNFQARLRRARERSRHQRSNAIQKIFDDEEAALEMVAGISSADDEELVAHLKSYLGARGAGALLDDPDFITPVRKKDKGRQLKGDFTLELQAQWAKDRAKKAGRRREREAARKRAELDPFGFGSGKGKGEWERNGKSKRSDKGKGKGKETQKATWFDPTTVLEIVPNAIVDVNSLESEIRRFVENVRTRAGGSQDGDQPTKVIMELPPMNKGVRKMVHEMAAVFKVKSVSYGGGKERYTTLIGTSWTGLGVKEGKLRAIMKRYGGLARGGGRKGGGGKGGQIPRHREGDEVGKEAPKIGESNIGFKMLASMGWSEGDRIGGTASVGIETPLTAIIKNSKLGLGATR